MHLYLRCKESILVGFYYFIYTYHINLPLNQFIYPHCTCLLSAGVEALPSESASSMAPDVSANGVVLMRLQRGERERCNLETR